MNEFLRSSLIALSLLLASCSSNQCRRKDKIPPLPGEQAVVSAKRDQDDGITKIRVYKYDGSLQCKMGQGIRVEDMARELQGAGIKVYSQESRPDGLMHPQVCGSPTGQVNAYEIEEKDLSRATTIGFKAWNLD